MSSPSSESGSDDILEINGRRLRESPPAESPPAGGEEEASPFVPEGDRDGELAAGQLVALAAGPPAAAAAPAPGRGGGGGGGRGGGGRVSASGRGGRGNATTKRRKRQTGVDVEPVRPNPAPLQAPPPKLKTLPAADNKGPYRKKDKEQLQHNMNRCERYKAHVDGMDAAYLAAHNQLESTIEQGSEYQRQAEAYMSHVEGKCARQQERIRELEVELGKIQNKSEYQDKELKRVEKTHQTQLKTQAELIKTLTADKKSLNQRIEQFEQTGQTQERAGIAVAASKQKQIDKQNLKEQAEQRRTNQTKKTMGAIQSHHSNFARTNQQYQFMQMNQDANGNYQMPPQRMGLTQHGQNQMSEAFGMQYGGGGGGGGGASFPMPHMMPHMGMSNMGMSNMGGMEGDTSTLGGYSVGGYSSMSVGGHSSHRSRNPQQQRRRSGHVPQQVNVPNDGGHARRASSGSNRRSRGQQQHQRRQPDEEVSTGSSRVDDVVGRLRRP